MANNWTNFVVIEHFLVGLVLRREVELLGIGTAVQIQLVLEVNWHSV
jgi:hypothetical protein